MKTELYTRGSGPSGVPPMEEAATPDPPDEVAASAIRESTIDYAPAIVKGAKLNG